MRLLDGDQLIGPVSLAIVMTIQACFVIAVQESVLRIFGGALDGLANDYRAMHGSLRQYCAACREIGMGSIPTAR